MHVGVSIVVQQARLPPVMLASHTSTGLSPGCSSSDLTSANGPGNITGQGAKGQGAVATIWEANQWMENLSLSVSPFDSAFQLN